MSKPFFVAISGLRNRPGARLDIELQAPLDELYVSGSKVDPESPVSFTGQVAAMEATDSVVVTGSVLATWTGDCRRCLGPASGEAKADVREIFEPEPVEGETYKLQSDGFDLEPLVRETVMLDLPEAPLCKADCAGLCPECGANHNDTTCSCSAEVVDLRWAALDALKVRE